MGLYAIGDLHLHFQSPLKSKRQLTDPVWKEHEEKLRKNCLARLTDEDTLVLLGDLLYHGPRNNLPDDYAPKEVIAQLNGIGTPIVAVRGNHDMFWDAGKTAQLNERFAGRLHFLQNNYYSYRNYALVGTKGHCFEGPFYLNARGQIVGWDEEAEAQAKKLVARELERLRCSFEAARADGFRRFIVFLHYPPTSILEDDSAFTAMAEEYGAEQLIYAHCHGERRFHDSIEGEKNGVRYSLASGDYLRWQPMKLLD